MIENYKSQLSFEDSLFATERKEANFLERLIGELKNCKYLRYRTQYAKITVSERLSTYYHLGDALEAGSSLVHKLSKRTIKYKHKTEEDFLYDIFIERIDHPPTKDWTRKELLHHNEEVVNRINGMILANKDMLKDCKPLVERLTNGIHTSHIILQRLNNAI